MTLSSSASRPYDVILYGATGFVGRQTVAYFAAHGTHVRWALAGRNASKLEAIRKDAGPGAAQAGLLVAAADDQAALAALAASARVVLSTAGPFALFGSALVAACVENGTHYVDITGETPWVRGLIDQHHAKAKRDGTRIIPCCGFDSVPSDLGAWLAVQEMKARYGEVCASVKASFSMRGGLNGGTLASALNMIEAGQQAQMANPYLLNPDPQTRKPGHPLDADPFAPHFDADLDAWLAPFVMSPINTRVVRRSAALLGYGDAFHYQEYMRFGKGPVAALSAAALSFGMANGTAAMRIGPVRRMAKRFAPAPGTGPSEASMNNGFFRCDLVAQSPRGKTVKVRLSGQGDPGNRVTTRMVCEAALAFTGDRQTLPGGADAGGVLTAASGLGQVLVNRLRDTGMKLECL
ncbi:MAG: saccharopine dehydrogenase NADP-binding domain-containing protein [Betaproteobacteria bacterium]|jgi:short subunit dehydrogenase-like uncharacterized protein|nr:saccharopine dehydrogenase NADP-binding domain-containing protein [Betaproteobacteria bacterium]